jgi:hypothetical protein
MNKLKNIFILLITLLSINGVMVDNVSLNEFNKKTEFKVTQKFHHVSVDSFVEDTSPNEDFNLEEDTDDTDDDFLETLFSKNVLILSKSQSIHSYYYSHSHQSVKRFILYCSLKLHC